MMMCIATMDSESMTWVALGRTEAEAKEALANEWNEHQARLEKEYGEKANYFEPCELEWEYGINVTMLNPGECECW